MRTGIAIAAAAALAWTGCGEQPSSSAAQQIVADEGAGDPNAPQSAEPAGASLDDLLVLKAKKYAKDWSSAGPEIRGELREGGHSDHLVVMRGGYCYRVVGVAGDGVADFDLLLFDANGVQVQQDPAQDRFPVLGQHSEICPTASAQYRVQAVMYKGGGPFVLGVYKTP
jgi:hypothetical protein